MEKMTNLKKRLVFIIVDYINKLDNKYILNYKIKVDKGFIYRLDKNGVEFKEKFGSMWLPFSHLKVSSLIQMIEGLEFIIEYEKEIKKLKDKRETWNYMTGKWEKPKIDYKKLEKEIRNKLKKHKISRNLVSNIY